MTATLLIIAVTLVIGTTGRFDVTPGTETLRDRVVVGSGRDRVVVGSGCDLVVSPLWDHFGTKLKRERCGRVSHRLHGVSILSFRSCARRLDCC